MGKRTRGWSVLSAMALLPMLVSHPCAAEATGPRYVLRSYGQADGLGNIAVHALSIDPAGFIWVGTENGLYRFIGGGFERFGAAEGMPEAYIYGILAAPDGTVWVATDKNLYVRSVGGFRPTSTIPLQIQDSGDMAWEGPGRLLTIDRFGLHRIEYGAGGQVKSCRLLLRRTKTSGFFRGLAVAPDGSIRMGCGTKICSVGSAGGEAAATGEWGPERGVPADERTSLLFDRRGSLWAESRNHLLELPKGGSRFVDRTPPHNDSANYYSFLPLAVDPRGRILVSAEDGITRWDGTRWQRIGPLNGLNSTHITSMVFDREGDLWMGSTGSGVHYWPSYDVVEGWTASQGMPSSNTWFVGLFDGERAFVGTAKGPVVIDFAPGPEAGRVGTGTRPPSSGAVTRLFSEEKWRYGQVTAMARAKISRDNMARNNMARNNMGSLWVATSSGFLVQIDIGLRKATPIAGPSAYIFGLLSLPDGRILIGASGGFYEFRPGVDRQPRRVAEANALLHGWTKVFNACLAADQSAWFATSRGLIRMLGASGGVSRWERPSIAGLSVAAPEKEAEVSCSADGSVWTVGDGSIHHIEGVKGSFRATLLPLPEAYQNLSIVGMAGDRRGRVWLGTDYGVLAWNGQSWRHLTQESGFIWNDANSHRVAEAPDGSILIGTSGGLGRIVDPDRLFSSSSLPLAPLKVTRGGAALDFSHPDALPWSSRELSFHFAVPDALARTGLRFRYRLPQLDPSWSETGIGTATFTSLPPGDYGLEAQAVNQDRGVVSTPVTIHFKVLPPWWMTWWFRCAAALVFAVIVLHAYLRRTRQFVRQRRLLEMTVRLRTAELEASRQELLIQATHDALTGLLNRAGILSALDRELERGRRERRPVTVVLADLDFFKRVNDTCGHAAGDEALRTFAKAVKRAARGYDIAGRYGGEEFLFVLPGLDGESALGRLNELHRSVSNLTFDFEGSRLPLTCSMGSATAKGAGSADAVLAAADLALYEAKTAGRNRLVHRLSLDPVATAREAIIHEARI